MPYGIILSPQALADLLRLRAHVRATVRAAHERHLRHEPTRVSKSRIKRLRGLHRPQYRLRVDDVRVFYDVYGMDVEVIAIIDKSGADTWLAQSGEPEEATDETDSSVGSEE
jgi:mRNA-degrading endonuclease RelE of RelBE toxin-antitoxin system